MDIIYVPVKVICESSQCSISSQLLHSLPPDSLLCDESDLDERSWSLALPQPSTIAANFGANNSLECIKRIVVVCQQMASGGVRKWNMGGGVVEKRSRGTEKV